MSPRFLNPQNSDQTPMKATIPNAMSEFPTDRQIAENILEADELLQGPLLKRLLAERYPACGPSFESAKDDKPFAAALLAKLFEESAKDRPALTSSEAFLLIKSLNGVQLPPVTLSFLPEALGSTAWDGHVEDPSSEPLRREIEDGLDPESLRAIAKTDPGAKFSSRLRALPPEQALAVLVGAIFWWGQRDFLPAVKINMDRPEVSNLRHFFLIKEA